MYALDSDGKFKKKKFQLDTREDRIRTLVQQYEGCKLEFSHKEKQFSDLQEKFLQSSVHIMEETVK